MMTDHSVNLKPEPGPSLGRVRSRPCSRRAPAGAGAGVTESCVAVPPGDKVSRSGPSTPGTRRRSLTAARSRSGPAEHGTVAFCPDGPRARPGQGPARPAAVTARCRQPFSGPPSSDSECRIWTRNRDLDSASGRRGRWPAGAACQCPLHSESRVQDRPGLSYVVPALWRRRSPRRPPALAGPGAAAAGRGPACPAARVPLR
jgi:hypothetical protein